MRAEVLGPPGRALWIWMLRRMPSGPPVCFLSCRCTLHSELTVMADSKRSPNHSVDSGGMLRPHHYRRERTSSCRGRTCRMLSCVATGMTAQHGSLSIATGLLGGVTSPRDSSRERILDPLATYVKLVEDCSRLNRYCDGEGSSGDDENELLGFSSRPGASGDSDTCGDKHIRLARSAPNT